MKTVIRRADLSDLDALVALENHCFSDDRISRRSFRRFLEMPRDRVLVAESDGALLGYSLVLMQKNTRLARIYSIAVSDEARGQGLGEQLVQAAEQAAVEADRIIMRLEVREDNAPAIRLYRRLGYRQFGTYRDYYEDHGNALRFERRILFVDPSDVVQPVPYYPQTTDFTCGPAALMMAMAAKCHDRRLTTLEELRIWREATTIFMLAGHGGCGPHGLALAGWHRGFAITAYVSKEGPLFKDTVRSPEKKRVLELVHEGFIHDMALTDIELHHEPITVSVIEDALARSDVPVILVNTWQLNRSRVPHWVTVCAMDEQFVYLHDPEVDVAEGETIADKQYLPVDRGIFEKMASYGHQQKLQAVVIVGAQRDASAPERQSA